MDDFALRHRLDTLREPVVCLLLLGNIGVECSAGGIEWLDASKCRRGGVYCSALQRPAMCYLCTSQATNKIFDNSNDMIIVPRITILKSDVPLSACSRGSCSWSREK